MSYSLIQKSEKRFIRLKSFFEPHLEFKLSPSDSFDIPFEIISKSTEKKTFKVAVSKLILDEKAPENLEGDILKCAKDYKQRKKSDQLYKESLLYLETSKYLAERKAEIEKQNKDLNSLVYGELNLKQLWSKIRLEYFPEREDIDHYKLLWSKRKHTSSLASCNVEGKKVIVAGAMNSEGCFPYLEPLLYHEMCHAILGVPENKNGRRIIHGKDFKELESKNPRIKDLDHWIKLGGWRKAVEDYEKVRVG